MREKVDEEKEITYFFYIYIISDHKFWPLLNVVLLFSTDVLYKYFICIYTYIYISSLSFTLSLIHPYFHTSSYYLIIQGPLRPIFRSLSLITYGRRLNDIITPPLLRQLLDNFSVTIRATFSKIENVENWKCQKSGRPPILGA